MNFSVTIGILTMDCTFSRGILHGYIAGKCLLAVTPQDTGVDVLRSIAFTRLSDISRGVA